MRREFNVPRKEFLCRYVHVLVRCIGTGDSTVLVLSTGTKAHVEGYRYTGEHKDPVSNGYYSEVLVDWFYLKHNGILWPVFAYQ